MRGLRRRVIRWQGVAYSNLRRRPHHGSRQTGMVVMVCAGTTKSAQTVKDRQEFCPARNLCQTFLL